MKKLLLLFALAPLLFAEPVADARKLQREAMEAYKAKDFATFLTRIQAASDLRPQHPTLLYYVAGALTLNGRHDDSLRLLERIAAMGMVYSPDQEPDFDGVRSMPGFAEVVKRFQANAAKSGAFTTALTIPERGLISEGLAWDGARKRILVSSVRKGAVYSNGKPLIRDLPFGVFGMAINRKRGLLWAGAATVPQFERFRAEESDRAAVLKIDLATGKLLATIAAPPGKHLFGDVSLAPNGDLYVSDSTTPVIYRVRDDVLQPFLATGPFVALQGLAVAGGTLYAADYSKGIYAVDLETRDAVLLRVPPEVSLLGVDGIYAIAGGLIATQNGTNPNRVIRIGLDGLNVTRVETLIANQDPLDDLTLGAVTPSGFLFNANAQWSQFGNDGKIKDETKLVDAVVLRVK